MALTDKLSAIGNAIREKTGGTELLTLDQMPTEIANITSGGGAVVQHIAIYDYSITTASKTTNPNYLDSDTKMTATTKLPFVDFGIKPDLSNLVAIIAEVGTYKKNQYQQSNTNYFYTSSYTYTPRLVPNENGGLDAYFRWYDEQPSNNKAESEANDNSGNYFKATVDEEGLTLRFYYIWGFNDISSNSRVGFKNVYVVTQEAEDNGN